MRWTPCGTASSATRSRAALPAFFPEAAYAQVKAISDPRADWLDRLVGAYRLDIGAAHALLSAGGTRARLLRVDVPAAFAHWVRPGACYNRIGYYEVPNARVVYRERAGGALIRDRLDDLVAGCLVRGSPRRRERRCRWDG